MPAPGDNVVVAWPSIEMADGLIIYLGAVVTTTQPISVYYPASSGVFAGAKRKLILTSGDSPSSWSSFWTFRGSLSGELGLVGFFQSPRSSEFFNRRRTIIFEYFDVMEHCILDLIHPITGRSFWRIDHRLRGDSVLPVPEPPQGFADPILGDVYAQVICDAYGGSWPSRPDIQAQATARALTSFRF